MSLTLYKIVGRLCTVLTNMVNQTCVCVQYIMGWVEISVCSCSHAYPSRSSLVTRSVRLCISLFVWLRWCFLSASQCSGRVSGDGARANVMRRLSGLYPHWPGRLVSLSQPICWWGSNPKPQLTWVHTCSSHACERALSGDIFVMLPDCLLAWTADTQRFCACILSKPRWQT